MTQLTQNSVYIPEDDLYIVSHHTHDYVEHTFRDGKTIAVDGGLDYGRRTGDLYELDEARRYQEWCLTTEDAFEPTIVNRLLWGTRGKDGSQPMTYRPIRELAQRPDGVEHLRAILKNCLNIAPLHKRVVEYWLDRQMSNAAQ